MGAQLRRASPLPEATKGSETTAAKRAKAASEIDSPRMDAPGMDGLDNLNSSFEQADPDSLNDEEARASEVKRFQEAADALPDLRKERIEELKRQIESGEYQVDSKAIAEKILDRHIVEDSF